MTYLETAAKFYSEVAETPQVGLCCVQSSPLQLPGLIIPQHLRDDERLRAMCLSGALTYIDSAHLLS